MDKINILVVEDDIDINGLLCKILTKQGYNVVSAYSGSEAKMCINHYDFQLILLDLMLPGISGEELIIYIRKAKMMPIIVISAKTEQDTKIEVLKTGADDFVSKPFDVKEVVARVESQLRRYTMFSKPNESSSVLKHKNLVLNYDKMEATIKDVPIALTVRQFLILKVLMSNPNKVFTKANLFQNVWNEEFLGDENTINVHMSNLRAKLAQIDPETEYIRTVWGLGFKMSD